MIIYFLLAFSFISSSWCSNSSELKQIIYEGLRLPLPLDEEEPLAADYNELTKKIDGNTGHENGIIEPEEVYEEVFANRQVYNPTIEKLRNKGLQDPFEITPEIKNHVTKLIEKYKPQSQVEIAVLLIRAIIDPLKSFNFNGINYFGLTEEEGGLEIRFPANAEEYLTKEKDYLPKQMIELDKDKRLATMEFNYLFTVFLRSAGIEAGIFANYFFIDRIEKPFDIIVSQDGKNFYRLDTYGYVITSLDGNTYKLGRLIDFVRTKERADSDRVGILIHYMNQIELQDEGQKKASMSMELPADLGSDDFYVWFNLGIEFREKHPYKAIAYLNRFLQFKGIKSNFRVDALDSKGAALYSLGKIDEALKSYKKILTLKPNDELALNNIGAVLYDQGKYAEALKYYNRLIAIMPHTIYIEDRYFYCGVWKKKVQILNALKKPKKSAIIYEKACSFGCENYFSDESN